MIEDLLDEPFDPYKDYYFTVKHALRGEGITLSFKVQMNALLGLSALDVTDEYDKAPLRDGFDMIAPMFYRSSFQTNHERSRMIHGFLGKIPVFIDEDILLKVSLSEDFSNSVELKLNPSVRDSKPFQLLLPFLTGKEQTLYVHMKVLNDSPMRKSFETKDLLNPFLRWLIDESKLKFLSDYSYNLNPEEVIMLSEKINEILAPKIPFNNVLKTQLFLYFLDQYRSYDEIEFEDTMKKLEEESFLKNYPGLVEELKNREEKIIKGESFLITRPITTYERF